MNTTTMIKSTLLWITELLFTFTIFNFNLSIGSTFYNWFAGLLGGFIFFWFMYFDEEVNNKAAFKMSLIGPSLSVFFGKWICEKYNIPLDSTDASIIYLLVAFFSLSAAKIAYGFSRNAEKELPAMLWKYLRKKLGLRNEK